MSDTPQIIELTDGIKCVSLEDYKKLQQERDEARVIGRQNARSGSWISVEDDLPDQDEWVLHAYYGVRKPTYGRHHGTRFFDGDGPESCPTTHWLPVPFIPEPNKGITQ